MDDPQETRRKSCLRVEMAVGWIDDPKFKGLRLPTLKAWLRMLDFIRINGTDGTLELSTSLDCCRSPVNAQRMLSELSARGLCIVTSGVVSVPAYLTYNRPHASIIAQGKRRTERTRKRRSFGRETGQQGDVVSLSPTEREGDSRSGVRARGARQPVKEDQIPRPPEPVDQRDRSFEYRRTKRGVVLACERSPENGDPVLWCAQSGHWVPLATFQFPDDLTAVKVWDAAPLEPEPPDAV